MLALLILFLLLALVVGIGGAIEFTLWFLLALVVAAVLGVLLLRRLVSR